MATFNNKNKAKKLRAITYETFISELRGVIIDSIRF